MMCFSIDIQFFFNDVIKIFPLSQLCHNLQSCDRDFLILYARCNIIGLLDAVAHSDAVSKITGND